MMMSIPKSLAKSSVIRHKLRKRVKFALELIVKRGANVEDDKNSAGKSVLIEGAPECEADKMIMDGMLQYILSLKNAELMTA